MSEGCSLDGELSSVNPGLIALTNDPAAWREQRRRAMREKIFGEQQRTDRNVTCMPSGAEQYMPLSSGGTAVPAAGSTSRSDDEAYVLQQILNRKRRLQEEKEKVVVPRTEDSQPSVAPELSLKERLMKKFGKV